MRRNWLKPSLTVFDIFQIVNTRHNGRCISLRHSREISIKPNFPITIDLKDVWKGFTKKGVYKIYIHEDKLEFNLIHLVSLILNFKCRL